MLIDQVDDHDRPIGAIPRSSVFSMKAGFRVSHIFIFNESKQLLLQRIARNRERHPGYWGSSVAAYLFSGENYIAAAVRRITKELGITGVDLQPLWILRCFFGSKLVSTKVLTRRTCLQQSHRQLPILVVVYEQFPIRNTNY